jgi:hypothetical protein
MKRFLSFFSIFLVGLILYSPQGHSIPLQLVMVTDELTVGRAILTGEDNTLNDGLNLVSEKKQDGTQP